MQSTEIQPTTLIQLMRRCLIASIIIAATVTLELLGLFVFSSVVALYVAGATLFILHIILIPALYFAITSSGKFSFICSFFAVFAIVLVANTEYLIFTTPAAYFLSHMVAALVTAATPFIIVGVISLTALVYCAHRLLKNYRFNQGGGQGLGIPTQNQAFLLQQVIIEDQIAREQISADNSDGLPGYSNSSGKSYTAFQGKAHKLGD